MEIFFSEVAGVESIPEILIKNGSGDVSQHAVCKIAPTKIFETFLWDLLWYSFSRPVICRLQF